MVGSSLAPGRVDRRLTVIPAPTLIAFGACALTSDPAPRRRVARRRRRGAGRSPSDDGGAPADAVVGGSFCSSRASSLFCKDFDDARRLDGFTDVVAAGGGRVTPETTGGFSLPGSLALHIPSGAQACVRHKLSGPRAALRVNARIITDNALPPGLNLITVSAAANLELSSSPTRKGTCNSTSTRRDRAAARTRRRSRPVRRSRRRAGWR